MSVTKIMQIHSYKVTFRLAYILYAFSSCLYFGLFIPRLVYTSAGLYFDWFILQLVYTSAGLFTIDNCCDFSLPDGLKTGKWYDVGVEKTKDNMKLTVGGDSLTLKTMVCRNYFFFRFHNFIFVFFFII